MKDLQNLFRKELNAFLVGKEVNLSVERSIELGKLKEAGDQHACKIMYWSGMRLAVYLAKKYKYILNLGACYTMNDLIQEGYVGLARAVDKYDYRKNSKFSVCAYFWIRQNILEVTATDLKVIHTPTDLTYLASRIGDVSDQFFVENGYLPELAEIFYELNCTEKEASRANKLGLLRPLSLDAYINSDSEKLTILDLLDRDRYLNKGNSHENFRDIEEQLLLFLPVLKTIEEEIICRLYLKDWPDDLQSIADKYGKSTEWVRQIKFRAIKKLQQAYVEHLNQS